MKLTKTASGKDVLSIDKGEWLRLGAEKGFTRISSDGKPQEVWQCQYNECRFTAEPEQFMQDIPACCPQCGTTVIHKFEQ